jgi:tRNA(fMet)-specific endonuclease VapC
MGLILDTSFIIAAERESRHRQSGPAHAFLKVHAEETFCITFTVAGELACGDSASALHAWRQLCKPFPILPWTIDIAWQYGESFRQLKRTGQLIGTNDLWIAATALAHGMPVVTRNVEEFQRVAGLSVVEF